MGAPVTGQRRSQKTDATEQSRWRWRQRAREGTANPLWLTAGAPVVLSLISLALSVYALIEANREPVIWLSAPDVVRLAAGDRPWFYVQPRLVSAARNDRVAIISGLRLDVVGPDGGPPTPFVWDEQGTWQYDPVGQSLTWIYQADPAPLVVAPSSPQLPICLFEGPPGWRWEAGTYHVTIRAARGQAAMALETSFTVRLPAASIELITTQPQTWGEARTQTTT